jgi:hypothetical protein
MNAREITSAAAIVLLAAVPRAQTPPPAAAGDRAAGAFLSTLRRGVANRDPATVAQVFQFPITVNAVFAIPVRNAADLRQYYDAFFTEDLVRAIACGPIQRSAAGITINKQLFAERRGDEFKIVRMSAHSVTPKKASAPRKPRRVIFNAPGYRLAPFAGTLERGDVDSYVIWVRKNEVLRVTLTGFKGNAASMRILNERRQPVDARAADVARAWTAPVPETGDYRIDVVRRAGQCEPPVVYDLAIRLQ